MAARGEVSGSGIMSLVQSIRCWEEPEGSRGGVESCALTLARRSSDNSRIMCGYPWTLTAVRVRPS
jgi:hypothetical protein